MTAYRLFPSTSGPSSPVSYSGAFDAAVAFEVTSGGMWFEGYWWWVCPSGQSTAPQTFALWQVYSVDSASNVSAATVTSGTLTPGQWNFVPLPSPIMLSVGGGANFANADAGGTAFYIACTAFTGSFPITSNQFGSGDPFSGGITNGPLTAFSDQSGSLAAPFVTPQGLFSTNGSVTGAAPFDGSASANFWIDVQVNNTAPASYSGSYRIWPNLPTVPGSISNDEGQQTTGTEFWLSEACGLDKIWLWSPPGATVLPSRCGIFNTATQAEAPGTDNNSPSWSGTAGSGWVSCSYSGSGVVLPSGKYRVAIYTGGGGKFYQEDVDYFSSGPGNSNIVNGPLTCPTATNATPPGNSIYQDGAWSYPNTFDNKDDGENRWIDVEVTPTGGTSQPTPVNSSAFLTFFP
jgi:hypothetical protein